MIATPNVHQNVFRDAYRKAIQVRDKSITEMEGRILDMLSESSEGVTTQELYDNAPLHTFPMRAAIWKLLINDVIEVTEDSTVRVKDTNW